MFTSRSLCAFAFVAANLLLVACNSVVGNVPPASSSNVVIGSFTAFSVPTKNGGPISVALGPDGAIWFTEVAANRIGRITTAGVVTEFPTLSYAAGSFGNYWVGGITAGSDGALWFTETENAKIGRMTTTGVLKEYALPTSYSAPTNITAGPDDALWFVESETNTIGRISTAGDLTEFPLPNQDLGHEAAAITAGPDGAVWFTESSFTLNGVPLYLDAAIGRISRTGQFTEYALPNAGAIPGSISVGSDHALCFSELDAVGRITTTGAITEFPLPSIGVTLNGTSLGPDGSLWISEMPDVGIGTNQPGIILRVTPAGRLQSFSVPAANSGPEGIALGADGALWFADALGNKIWRLR